VNTWYAKQRRCNGFASAARGRGEGSLRFESCDKQGLKLLSTIVSSELLREVLHQPSR
jgi:hypothetical protein